MNQDCKKKVVVGGKDRYIFVRWDEGAKTDSLQVLGYLVAHYRQSYRAVHAPACRSKHGVQIIGDICLSS
jgi:hypothetical protein